ncbi:MAG: hypothetical protein ACI4HQ_01565 [Acetatifactor sp.]
MDRIIMTSRDMQMIMAGLRSLDSVSGSHYYSRLMEKIKAGSSEFRGNLQREPHAGFVYGNYISRWNNRESSI